MTATEGLVPSSGWRCRSSRYTCAPQAVGGCSVRSRATMRPNDRAHTRQPRQLAARPDNGSEADRQPEFSALWAAGGQRRAIATCKAARLRPAVPPSPHLQHHLSLSLVDQRAAALWYRLLQAAAGARRVLQCYEEEAIKWSIMLQHTALPRPARAVPATRNGAWSGTAYLLPGPRNWVDMQRLARLPAASKQQNVKAKIKGCAPCP